VPKVITRQLAVVAVGRNLSFKHRYTKRKQALAAQDLDFNALAVKGYDFGIC
jgi:hypothetical protein